MNIVRGIAKHILLKAGGANARAGASGEGNGNGESATGDADYSGRDVSRDD